MGEQMMEGVESEEESDPEDHVMKRTEVEEQKHIKKAFLKKVKEEEDSSDDSDIDTFFSKKEKTQEEKDQDQLDLDKAKEENQKSVDAYFSTKGEKGGEKNKLSKDDKFLRNFISNEWWKATDTEALPSFEEITGKEKVFHPDESEDEDILDDQDAFEAAYNFRFEAEGGFDIVTYPREIEDSLRQSTSKRKRQRDAKSLRVTEEKARKAEELKRLKNIKQKEILDKLDQIKAITGTTMSTLGVKDLTGSFDPEEYDKMMAGMFDNEFHEQEDMDDDALYKDIMGDELEEMRKEMKPAKYKRTDLEKEKKYTAKQLKRAKQRQKKQAEAAEYYDEDGEEEGGNQWALPDGVDPVAAAEKAKEELDKQIKDLYNLDYEDIIGGDIPCRFKYTNVAKATFGIEVKEVLELPDSELNQMVSIKKLAPYRDDVIDRPWWTLKGIRGKPAARRAAAKAKKEGTVFVPSYNEQTNENKNQKTSINPKTSENSDKFPKDQEHDKPKKSENQKTEQKTEQNEQKQTAETEETEKTEQKQQKLSKGSKNRLRKKAAKERQAVTESDTKEETQESTGNKGKRKRQDDEGQEGQGQGEGQPSKGEGGQMSKSKKRKLRMQKLQDAKILKNA